MPNFKLSIGYDGADFYGSQIQANVRTVQGELEQAVATVAEAPARLIFAGRTDRGVHARGQVVSGDIAWRRGAAGLRKALNAVAPDDIAVFEVDSVDDRFQAQFDACWRQYRYRIYEAEVRPVLDRNRVWWRRDTLDTEAIQCAARYLEGRHAFGTFAGFGKSQSLTAEELKRTVYLASWSSASGPDADIRWVRTVHEFTIVAEGYLPQMVRNIVAALVQVGRGDQPPEWVQYLVAANDRRVLGEAAPPHGLILEAVGYEEYNRSITYSGARAGSQSGEGLR